MQPPLCKANYDWPTELAVLDRFSASTTPLILHSFPFSLLCPLQSFEALSARAVAVVIDPIQSVKGKVVIDAFRLIGHQMQLSTEPRQTTSNLGHLQKPSIQVCRCSVFLFIRILCCYLLSSFTCRRSFTALGSIITPSQSTTGRTNWNRRYKCLL